MNFRLGQSVPSLAKAYAYEQNVLHTFGTLNELIAPAMVARYDAEIVKENPNIAVLLTCVGFIAALDEDSIQYIDNTSRGWGISSPRAAGGGGGAAYSSGSGRQVPNRHGRRGGPRHQAVVKQTQIDLKNRGISSRTEFYVQTPGGQKRGRFVDVVALDVNGDPVQFYQAGRITKGGQPVARERYAISDIFEFGGYDVPIHFIPYNN